MVGPFYFYHWREYNKILLEFTVLYTPCYHEWKRAPESGQSGQAKGAITRSRFKEGTFQVAEGKVRQIQKITK